MVDGIHGAARKKEKEKKATTLILNHLSQLGHFDTSLNNDVNYNSVQEIYESKK